ncbi:MAG: cyclase family protein [Saprospiraceae bacterium]|nr:cyclase family protein [Saprospiraceae bacterium]MCB0624677.1 cyclase family protein [Saprospiraceae bacterium]MCB0679375.1 cyclase family protein [Saprospiraceae bacterium]
MIATLRFRDRAYRADLDRPIDLSLPLHSGVDTVNCFYAPYFEASPVVMGDFIGSTAQGGPVNFLNVRLNPHGNGTHTECVGHISVEPFTIHECLQRFHFPAWLTSLYPQRLENGDRVLLPDSFAEALAGATPCPALVVRTLPNDPGKRQRHYSGTNPPYLHPEAIDFLVEWGVIHLLIDLPSVDREEDGGQLLSHKAFWRYPNTETAGRLGCTITELIYVPDETPDGLYLLNLQIGSFEIDASPSKPVLYALHPQ